MTDERDILTEVQAALTSRFPLISGDLRALMVRCKTAEAERDRLQRRWDALKAWVNSQHDATADSSATCGACQLLKQILTLEATDVDR